jgi:hypothetical protein
MSPSPKGNSHQFAGLTDAKGDLNKKELCRQIKMKKTRNPFMIRDTVPGLC